MRYIRYAFIAILAALLVCVALANRSMVSLQLLPPDVATLFGVQYAVSLPLFLVIFIGIVAGLLIGFVWEWLREHKHRSAAAQRAAEAKRLERELKRTRAERDKGKDEVLAILDQPRGQKA